MKTATDLRDTLFVLFGAGGDLSQRLIVPALFNLYLDGRLPGRFLLLGVDRAEYDDAALAARYREGIANFSRRGAAADDAWKKFAATIHYFKADASDAAAYARLGEKLGAYEKDWSGKAERIFYLATPPSLFEPVAQGLGAAGLAHDREHVRIVVEKPLGHDLDSFCEINRALRRSFIEPQIFRIDHFLGKETVQNILAMRFANPIFEPIWNRRYVDHVVVTVAETLGVEHRGRYYERAGALRDMVQN
ncbi:MAG TPA: glucose-6-phosphate dehydrogenase, partial [Candidatus Methylomirabilis sp.]|nr:glucose-6-phosphate dehydrogenase [Candidatus Methylomirabilis sp.]